MPLLRNISSLALFLFIFSGSSWEDGRLLYQHPKPGTDHVSPSTNIVFRLNTPWHNVAGENLPSRTIRGSMSGPHNFRITRSDDPTILIITPDRPFLPGEKVSVTGFTDGRVSSIEGLRDFEFTVGQPDTRGPRPDFDGEMPANSTAAGLAFSAAGDTLPLDFPYIQSYAADTNEPGKIFVTNLAFFQTVVPYLLVLENNGRPAFYRKMPSLCFDFKVQPNGLLTYYQSGDNKFYALDSNYTIVGSFATGNGYTTDIHELKLLPNGHALLMAYDPEIVDMSGVVPGGNPSATVTGLILQEIDSLGQVVFEWRSWDHFQITDATHENLTAASIDYVHGNAIDLDEDGNILLSNRHMDEITKINRQDGSIVWRMGGKHNEFTFFNDSIGFSHQHAIRNLHNGHFLLFDNGNFHAPQFSRAIEYVVDESLKTATRIWEYRHSPDIYGQAMGYAQRLDNGNTLIGWGATNPNVTEVRPDGSIAYEMSFATGTFSYRAYRFPWKEANQSSQPQPVSAVLYQNYPNPFNISTRILLTLSKESTVSLSVYDINGRLVKRAIDGESKNSGIYYLDFDGSMLSSGTYYYQLIVNGLQSIGKMQLMK